MNFAANAANLAETFNWPDAFLRGGISALVSRTHRNLAQRNDEDEQDFARWMADAPVASHTGEANRQHYEIPAQFFELALGPRRKYSSCYFSTGQETLAEAEDAALEITADHAKLQDGQAILELGCGWGSLTLWMAHRFPNARIVAVSNSASQRLSILQRAAAQNLRNVEVITCDMNAFATNQHFDRVVSVEMFEHMSNWPQLMRRVAGWLAPGALFFMHVFSHTSGCYRFDTTDKSDWIAQHFFTGGIMPSHTLVQRFSDVFEVQAQWRWSGVHYQKTADEWLRNFDANLPAIEPILQDVYGADAALWRRRWRMFFLATSGLFGHANGEAWGVSHYLLKPQRA